MLPIICAEKNLPWPGIHILSDWLTGIAYIVIACQLWYIIHKRPDIPRGFLFYSFGMFIISCGLGHWMSILVLFFNVYPTEGVIKVTTMLSSVGTMFMLWYSLPYIIKIQSPVQLEEQNRRLQAVIDELGKRHMAEELVGFSPDKQIKSLQSLTKVVGELESLVKNTTQGEPND